jgi:hypothetical protein
MAGFSAAGQGLFNWWSKPAASTTEGSVEHKAKGWSWASLIPMKHMTNEEYAEMLVEKLLKVDVEISILDDKIAALKSEHQEGAGAAGAVDKGGK